MILVTGGTGLVGSHLLYQLTQENNLVLATYRSKEKQDVVKKVFSYHTSEVDKYFAKIKWLKADITDIPLLEKVFSSEEISKVYHCAALISFGSGDYQQMRQINIEGTANLINFSVAYKIKKFCFVSSIAAVGDAVKDNIISEENEWNEQTPKSCYAITKFGAEMEVWRGSQEGLEVVIVNPGIILGTGFKEGSSKIFEQIKNGFKFYTEGITGFVGVKDVVEIMMRLMNTSVKNERFILVSENKSFKDVFFKIADEFGVKRPSIKIGKLALRLLWRIDWLISQITRKKPLITKSSARSSYQSEFYTSQKIKSTLQYEFTPIDKVIEQISQSYL